MNLEEIRNQIILLRKQTSLLYTERKNIDLQIDEVESKIENIYKNFPKCYSCDKNQDPKFMFIAVQEDLDNYKDSNEGYNEPEIGEYYCGC